MSKKVEGEGKSAYQLDGMTPMASRVRAGSRSSSSCVPVRRRTRKPSRLSTRAAYGATRSGIGRSEKAQNSQAPPRRPRR